MSQTIGERDLQDGFVKLKGLGGDDLYAIRNHPRLGPFLVNVVSASDLWMFVSSRGGLTAGRVEASNVLFAYETVDRLHESHVHTGPVTSIQVKNGDTEPQRWEPFLDSLVGSARATRTRNLYKSFAGNQLVFEEQHRELGLTLRYRWTASDELGFVRTVILTNDSPVPVQLDLLDGLRNIQPWGISLPMQQSVSCLADAYKRCEVDAATELGIYSMTAGIVDGTYPTDILRANVVWHRGLDGASIHLSHRQLDAFRNGEPIESERLQKGGRGNYFLVKRDVQLDPGESLTWHLVSDVGLGHVQLASLRNELIAGGVTEKNIELSLEHATELLRTNVAAADGLQHTADLTGTAHHFSNVLFNNMRGGVFVDRQQVGVKDLADFVCGRNAEVFERHQELLASDLQMTELKLLAADTEDVDLWRLMSEFLPLTFGRRHGDPSRPWNHFSIQLKKPDGGQALRYQGNWRDIFQNWEALAVSFPTYLECMVAKFVNGTTVDGFNPYRVTDEGMEWESPDETDAWANIGYWGDHQIIYLLKLLESLDDRRPERLQAMLDSSEFVYLNVPYRIRSYADLLRNTRETIEFDFELDAMMSQRCDVMGEDGKLLQVNGAIKHVNLCEKLLVPMLSKLSNFVAGGGIWMNTQRPEWNDANNALVGNGLSVVTLCYLRRYLTFLSSLMATQKGKSFEVSQEVVTWMEAIDGALRQHRSMLQSEQISDTERRQLLDSLGLAFCEYRAQAYENGLTDSRPLDAESIERFCALAIEFADDTIRRSVRADGLYHAYNFADFSSADQLRVRHLYEMLEGQVAVLSAGILTPSEVADLVETMYESRIYRADQHTFTLYPNRELPDFLDKNVIPEDGIESNPLLAKLLDVGDASVVQQDVLGAFRFHPDFQQTLDLDAALEKLLATKEWKELVVNHREQTVELFENVFQHQAYTGRSGTMYGYEGLGCIYWHMVAKLLLAVQENHQHALSSGDSHADRLKQLYFKVRAGLGCSKTPQEYGAFPVDAYSHTPAHMGAQQPGMTGQVKEEILTRQGELGVGVDAARLRFEPSLLERSELLEQPTVFRYFGIDGRSRQIDVPANALAFTYCQVPIVYQLVDSGKLAESICLRFGDADEKRVDALVLDEEASGRIFERDGTIASVHVQLHPSRFS